MGCYCAGGPLRSMPQRFVPPSGTRRDFLAQGGIGLGGLALAWILHQGAFADDARRISPLAPKQPHFPPKAKNIIYLFMHGGPSHLETFDPKPELARLSGKPLPESFGSVVTSRNVGQNPLLATTRSYAPRGQSGIEISDLFPHLATCADDLAVIRSCYTDSVDHARAVYQMNTGATTMGKPCLGSWVGYGLGTENQNLPAFVVLPQPGGAIKGGPPAFGSGFLPAPYQGTVVRGGDLSNLELRPFNGMSADRQRRMLEFIRQLDMRHATLRDGDAELEARIRSYELAYRMQSSAPEAVDFTTESNATKALYGIDDHVTADFGTRCLLARRLVERGVRFVQLFSGDLNGWDGHEDVQANHANLCACVDRPIAGLLRDLKSRGLFESTLVVWGGEFGRLPMSENKKGRDHNPYGFTMWLAGAGIKGGVIHGATDDVGLRAVIDRVHVHDVHATILHLMGLDHTQLTYTRNDREERLTDMGGRVVRSILA
jgi:Protein of unknown function (DUF1501)